MTNFQIDNENQTRTKVLVIKPVFSLFQSESYSHNLTPTFVNEESLTEAANLALAIDLDIINSKLIHLKKPNAATLFGKGKVEQIALEVQLHKIDLVVIDHQLTPGQQFKLEKALKAKVLDRSGLILEIFGKRARTKEGRIQVELAHLNYQKSRLVRSWTHLERQRGGGRFLGGPGETQLEADKRQLQGKILKLQKDLAKVRKTRTLQRHGRQKNKLMNFALVGYTNAGKSTLFNQLSNAAVMAKDMVFATLDPTIRTCQLPSKKQFVLSDTVGFIQDLPTHLIEAFKATLEEVLFADYIVHVSDCANPLWTKQIETVEHILKDLGLSERDIKEKIINIWNKCDLLDAAQFKQLQLKAEREKNKPVLITATKQETLAPFYRRIENLLLKQTIKFTAQVAPTDGAIAAWFYENGNNQLIETNQEGVSIFEVELNREQMGQFQKKFPDYVATIQNSDIALI